MTMLPDQLFEPREESVIEHDGSDYLPMAPGYMFGWPEAARRAGHWPDYGDPFDQPPTDPQGWIPPDERIPPDCLPGGEIPVNAVVKVKNYCRCTYIKPEEEPEPFEVDDAGCMYFVLTESCCPTIELWYTCHFREYLAGFYQDYGCMDNEKIIKLCPDPVTGSFTALDGTFIGTTEDIGYEQDFRRNSAQNGLRPPQPPPRVRPDTGPNAPVPPPIGPPPMPPGGGPLVWMPPETLGLIAQQAHSTPGPSGVQVHTQQVYKFEPPAVVKNCVITVKYRLKERVRHYTVPGGKPIDKWQWRNLPAPAPLAIVEWKIPECEPLP